MSGGQEYAAGNRQDRSAAGDRNPWLIAVVVSIATFMQVLDASIVNVALVHIAGSLATGLDESTWVITTYLIASGVAVPISAWLMGVVGRKRFYMLCVGIFTASSLLCGLASSLPMLILFRILQGLGGGGMVPSEQAILADTFSPRQRPQAFALYGIAVIVAPTIGPTIGGWITDNWSWHWLFFINIPMGILSLTLVQWLLIEPETLERERKERLARRLRVDWIGIALVVLWLGCLEFVLDRGQREDWFQSNLIIAFAVVSAVSFVLFIPWELSREDPIVDLRLMRRLQFLISFVMMMMVGAVLLSTSQLLPQLMQEAFGYTATLAGLALMPGGFAMLVLMPIAGIATNQFQPKYLLAFGMGVIALAMWHLTSLPTDASFHFFEWARVLQMIGMPFLFVPITTAAYAGLPPEMTNQASSLVNVARNLGGSIGVSMAVTLLARREQFHQVRLTEHLVPSSPLYQDTLARATSYFITAGSTLPDAKHRAMAWLAHQLQMQTALLSYIDVFYVFALCAALMVAVALILLRRIERHEHIPNAY